MAEQEEPRIERQPRLSIHEIADQADIAAGRRIANVFTSGQRKIGKPEVLARIARQSDLYDGTEWNGPAWDAFGDYMKARRLRLGELLKTVHDDAQIIDALRTWTEEEMQNLFFVTNDLPTARQMIDYFRHFYPNFMKSLVENKLMDADAARITEEDIDSYIDCCFEGYDHLRGIILKVTNDRQSSLVEFSHPRSNDPRKPDPWKDRRAVLDPQKREAIMQTSRECFRELVLDGLVETTGETYVDPLDVYLIAEATKIAVTGISKRYPHTAQLKRTPPKIDLEEQREVRRILGRCYKEINAQGDHIGCIVKIAEILNEEERKSADLPADFIDVYENAMRAAEKHCSKDGFSRYWRQHNEKLNFSIPEVTLKGVTERMWPWYGTEGQATSRVSAFAESLPETLKEPVSLREWALQLEGIADASAKQALLAMDSPEMLLYLHDYIDALIREMTPKFKEARKYKANEKEFAALAAVRDKCQTLHDAVVEWKYWTLEYTNGNYDNPGQLAHVQLLPKMPVPIEDLNDHGALHLIFQPAALMVGEMVKKHGLVDKQHRYREDLTLFPVIYNWAHAAAEANAQPLPEAPNKFQKAEHELGIKTEAIRLFQEGLDKLRAHKKAEKLPITPQITAEDVLWLKDHFKDPLKLVKIDINRPPTSGRMQ